MIDEKIKPWDSDHTALVHVLWKADRKGIELNDFDELASLIMQSRWMRAVRLHHPANVALAELVRLKDGPRDDAYRAEKDDAWEAARRALS